MQKIMIKDRLLRIASNRVLHHTLFWLISYFVFANTFKVSAHVQPIDYIYSVLFHISLVISVYINLILLIPKLFSKQRFVLFFIGFILTLNLGAIINEFTFNWLSDRILKDYYFISYYSYFDLLKFMLVYLFITTLLKLSKSWFRVQEVNYRLATIQKENINSELKALKAQINPHFLFNSLNLIYTLAVKNSSKTPNAIIQLSDILRYVTYKHKDEKVELKAEIKLINNYLALQKLRVDSSASINFECKVKNDKQYIAPMLFLPLIENSFKHGIGGEISNLSFVNISLKADEKAIEFNIENNKGRIDKILIKEEGGIGLDNIKKRLELLYQDKYEFEINDSNDKFGVRLKLIYEN